MVATSLGELRADVGGRRDAGNNQQRRSGASGRVEPALLAARTGRVLPARLPLCVAGFGSVAFLMKRVVPSPWRSASVLRRPASSPGATRNPLVRSLVASAT